MAKRKDVKVIGTETVDRTVLFGVIDWKLKNKNVNIVDVFQKINGLSFADGSRYYQTSEGKRYEVILRDKITSATTQIFGQIGDSRVTDLPYLEKQGALAPLKIAQGEGIFDATHFLIQQNKKGTWIIVYEFNFYAPRITSLNVYVQNKLQGAVDYVAIGPIAGDPISKILKRLQDIKSIRLGIHGGADVSTLSSGLSDALKSLQGEQNGTFIDISFSVRHERKKTLEGNLIKNIPSFFKTINPQLSMEYFIISGIRSDTGKRDEVNLMDIILKEKKEVQKMDKDHRFVDPDKMYAALTEAYITHQSDINKI
jgi:hypothetical protein